MGMAPAAETMPKALTAARRAVALDSGLAEGHCALALALLLWERDYAAANDAFLRCLELNPQYTQGRCWHAAFNLQWVQGRLDESLVEARRALDADPLSAYATSLLAITLGTAGQTTEGLEFARLGVQRDPDSLLTQWIHALVAHWDGAFEESVTAFKTAAAVSDSHAFTLAHCVVAYANWGRVADARTLHDQLCAISTTVRAEHHAGDVCRRCWRRGSGDRSGASGVRRARAVPDPRGAEFSRCTTTSRRSAIRGRASPVGPSRHSAQSQSCSVAHAIPPLFSRPYWCHRGAQTPATAESGATTATWPLGRR